MKTLKELEEIARNMRLDILKMSYHCGPMGAHLGGSMSAVDILAVLFTEVMRHEGESRDRFIMSKAHAAMALYAALHQIGKVSGEEVDEAMQDGALLYKHPCMNPDKGVEFSGGSLGQGLSLGVGTALALKIKQNLHSKVYVMIGDGECDEGAVWEAAASASHYGLDNLVVIVDKNGLQNDGTTEEIMNFPNMEQRWEAFGFETQAIQGHNMEQIRDALCKSSDRPRAIIAETVKGKGVSFAENAVDWHASYLTEELYIAAMEELSHDAV